MVDNPIFPALRRTWKNLSPRKNSTLKKRIIILLIITHSIAITAWSLLDQRLHALTSQAEQSGFLNSKAFNLLAIYIAVSGNEQYWDFFADSPYNEHLSLIVCDRIVFPGPGEHVECSGNIIYQSYDGKLNQILKGYDGNRNRAYRFVEHLVALNDDRLYQQFLIFWHERMEHTASDTLYLIVQFSSVLQLHEQMRQDNQLFAAIDRS